MKTYNLFYFLYLFHLFTANTIGAATNSDECFSISLGYPCCSHCEGSVYGDEEWGVENDSWCGLKYSCFRGQLGEGETPGQEQKEEEQKEEQKEEKEKEEKNEKNECFSIPLGYPCCSHCEGSVYGDEEWGVENDSWCGLKYSCFRGQLGEGETPGQEQKEEEQKEEQKEEKEKEEKKEKYECFSIPLGYPCCSHCEKSIYYNSEDEGIWGVENNNWCGLKDSCFRGQLGEGETPGQEQKEEEQKEEQKEEKEKEEKKEKYECFSIPLGYPCCSHCEKSIYYNSEDEGIWGVENNNWCGLKDSCFEN